MWDRRFSIINTFYEDMWHSLQHFPSFMPWRYSTRFSLSLSRGRRSEKDRLVCVSPVPPFARVLMRQTSFGTSARIVACYVWGKRPWSPTLARDIVSRFSLSICRSLVDVVLRRCSGRDFTPQSFSLRVASRQHASRATPHNTKQIYYDLTMTRGFSEVNVIPSVHCPEA